MPAAKQEPQKGLFDRVIEDEKLERAIARFIETKEPAKVHAEAKKLLNAALNEAELTDIEDGEKIRVGAFLIEGRKRAGGGFEVPAWEKNGIGRIAIGNFD